ncbi:MAG: HAD family hydrolase [Candidatus Binataceae bacterium]
MTAKAKKPRSARIRALLFDYGNTLAFLDYELLAREFSTPARRLDATALERAEYEGRATLDRILMGPNPPADLDQPYRHYFRAWLRAAGIEDEDVLECGRRFTALHAQASLWRVVRAGTLDTLERLKSAGFKLAIVSNADGRVEDDARRLGMAPLFDAIIDSQVVGVAKPDPRIF